MPVQKDASGRSFVSADVDVPGTPDEVWRAIATGPGISSWFVPSTVEERVGGTAASNFGPGMESRATVTVWEPPRRWAFESQDTPDSPLVATEWTVEARSGGTCNVRVVHAWFSKDDDWDKQFDGHEKGWQAFFRILRLYLEHFRGQPAGSAQAMVMTPGSTDDVWSKLQTALGIANANPGTMVRTANGAPALAGTVEHRGPEQHPELLLRVTTPQSGLVHMFAMPMAGNICLPVRAYFYGTDAEATARREEATWTRWLQEQFPS